MNLNVIVKTNIYIERFKMNVIVKHTLKLKYQKYIICIFNRFFLLNFILNLLMR